MPSIDQFGAILFTVRDFCKTEKDLAETLGRVRAIGFRAVQVSGVPAEIPAAKIRELLDQAGLVACGTHENGDLIRRDPRAALERVRTLGADFTAYPFPAGVDFGSEESVAALVADLNAAGAVFRDAGCQLLYHNHAHEFFRTGGRTILERIYADTDPACLGSELDTFWVQAGGGDVLGWIRAMAGRMGALHLKDYAVNPMGERQFAEIGQGNLPFPEIIGAAEEGGCPWFIVEQDRCPGDPFDSLQTSFDYIRDNLTD